MKKRVYIVDDHVIVRKALTELINREEALAARKAVGGVAEAGQEPVKPKEETPKEYNDRIEKEISEGKHGD